MRTTLLVALLPTLAFAQASSSKVNCTINADPDDLVAKGRDLEVNADQKVKDAVVVEGNLVIHKGASVKSAVVLRGNVTIEAGATVRDSVIVIGGHAKISKSAIVKGSKIVLDEGLHLTGEDGKELDLALSINGEALGTRLAAELLKDVHACKVTSSAE